MQLTWKASVDNGGPGLAGYYVYRNPASGQTLEPGTQVAIASLPGTQTSYLDTTVVASSSYVYTVVAIDAAKPPAVSPEAQAVVKTP